MSILFSKIESAIFNFSIDILKYFFIIYPYGYIYIRMDINLKI